ncbi:MAG: peptidase T [Candidatus Marinimicrobia bacterium]|nr:peptidase T [Candidatus Neomarinimicrobiota bacterium]
MRERMLKRFFRYVKIDTQSKEGVEDQYPSTEKQKKLLKILVDELKELGCPDVEMDDNGYVMGTYPSNLENKDNVPVIGLIAHVDTSPEVSGKNVKPVIHENYNGGNIKLPGDASIAIKAAENPALKEHIGDDIITSDGTTLLGADNKAGITEILTTLEYLNENPDIKHGEIKIGFTPDEEVGNGTKYFDVEKFGAKYAYTVDGETVGEIENETFNAALAKFEINGVNVHPGYAKDKLVNSIKIGAEVIKRIGQNPAPETTEKREGYLHPYKLDGDVGQTKFKVLIRDFEKDGMQEKRDILNKIKEDIAEKYPGAEIKLDIEEQYENMKVILEKHEKVVQYALDAVKKSNLEPKLNLIRGGTDGARLCFMGLPTPNIFTGGHNFHSKKEWIAIQGMEKTVETLVNLLQIWAKE